MSSFMTAQLNNRKIDGTLSLISYFVNSPVNNFIIIIFNFVSTDPYQNITSVYMNLINISDRYTNIEHEISRLLSCQLFSLWMTILFYYTVLVWWRILTLTRYKSWPWHVIPAINLIRATPESEVAIPMLRHASNTKPHCLQNAKGPLQDKKWEFNRRQLPVNGMQKQVAATPMDSVSENIIMIPFFNAHPNKYPVYYSVSWNVKLFQTPTFKLIVQQV